jgi:hypothetical protein
MPIKKVNFAVSSKFVHGQEELKYDKTDELIDHWDEMTDHIDDAIKDKDVKRRQAGVCAWLVKNLGLRIGGERVEGLADTVGASTLLVKNASLSGTTLSLNFLAKDSVPYKNKVELTPLMAKGMSECLANKKPSERIFDKISGGHVSLLMKEVLPNISPKSFRSAQGCMVLVKTLKELDPKPEWNDAKKKAAFIRANLAASQVLNHQKNIGKNYAEQEGKATERAKLAADREKERKTKAAQQMKDYQKQLATAKSLWTGEKLKTKVELIKTRMARLKTQVERAEERTEKAKISLDLKKETKSIALGTALSSYCSPRIVYSICKEINLPVEKIYTQSLLSKQKWAENTPASYWRTVC